jgi:starch synthase
MKVLFVTSEVAPYSKTGGLADVSSGLPSALANEGVQVKVATPMYRSVGEGGFPLRSLKSRLDVRFRGRMFQERVFLQRIKPELSFYFIKRDEFFDRSGLYGTDGGDYFDNADRFIFFSRAALSLCRLLRFKPDIIHCHDWQTALIPAMLKTDSGEHPQWHKIRTVFTIHNLAYQGVFPQEYMAASGLPPELFVLDGLEFYGQMNFMKAGIVFGDRITTVSRTYAKDILTPEFGYGLDGVLREHKGRLHGILNGVDYADWDPVKDPYIARRFSSGDLSGKADCKRELREIFALTGLPTRPILGIVARLVEQKGLDLVVKAVDRILKTGADLVILGSGDDVYQKELSALARRHQGRMGVRIGFDPGLAHKIEAGADMFLMPSRFEPCGLNQMYSLKYGTIPIVRATGGLEDSIQEFDPETLRGNGFKFKPYTAAALVSCIKTAVAVFKQKSLWSILMKNAMWADFSWDKAAGKYLKLYRALESSKRTPNL